jgi:hypothetical protein
MVREAMKAGLSFDLDRVQEMGCMDAVDGFAVPPPTPQAVDPGIEQAEMPPTPPQTHSSEAEPGQIPDIFIRTPSTTMPSTFKTPRFDLPNSSSESSDAHIGPSTDSSVAPEDETHHHSPLSAFHEMMHKAHTARIHDSLRYDCGMGFLSVLSWRLMEYLPFRRMDLQPDGSWKPIRWPLPCGEVRDVPDNVRVHGSVIRRMQGDAKYRPGNLIVGGGGRGVRFAPEKYGIGGK